MKLKSSAEETNRTVQKVVSDVLSKKGIKRNREHENAASYKEVHMYIIGYLNIGVSSNALGSDSDWFFVHFR